MYAICEIFRSGMMEDAWLTSYSSLAVGAVSVSFNTVPYCSADCLSQSVSLCLLFPVRSTLQAQERTPMQNAPPKSDNATHGQGSREWSRPCPSAIVRFVL